MSSPESGAGPWSPRSSSSGEAPLLELEFRPGPLVPRGALWLVVLVAVLLGSSEELLEPFVPSALHGPALEWAVGIAGFVLIAVSLALRSRTRSGPVASLQAYRDHLIVPRSAGARRSYDLPYRDVFSLELLGSAEQLKLVIGTRRYLLIYPLSSLYQPELVGELRTLLREQLAARGEGERLLEQMDERESFGRAVRMRSSRVTSALCLSVALVYALEQLSGALADPFGLLSFGANAPALVRDGQLYRLFAASFLHANFLHLFMNGTALWVLGVTLERVIGPWRFALIYLLSALAGSLASLAFAGAPLSVGASAAVFGLLGSMAVIQWRHGLSLPTGFRQPVRWWVLILGLNTLLPLLVPQIDVAAHAGGFVAGALLAVLLAPRLETIRYPSVSRGVRGAALVVTAAYAAAFGQAVLRSFESQRDDRALIISALLDERETASPVELNDVAMFSLIDRDASPDELRLARQAAQRALELEPESPEIADTLATAEYRLGNFDRAVALERDVLARVPDRIVASQLARFLAARQKQKGALVLGPSGPHGARLELVREKGPSSERQLRLVLEGNYERGAELWFVERSGNALEGFGTLHLGPTSQHDKVLGADLPVTKSLQDFRLELALIDTGACGECPPDSVSWQYQLMSPAIRDLP
jgi:rhomboid protease GluP